MAWWNGPKPLRRKVGVRQPRKTVLVVCEGRRTEPEYLQALKREPSVRDVAAVDLRIEPHRGTPRRSPWSGSRWT